MKGWYGSKYGHSLASKGISTKHTNSVIEENQHQNLDYYINKIDEFMVEEHVDNRKYYKIYNELYDLLESGEHSFTDEEIDWLYDLLKVLENSFNNKLNIWESFNKLKWKYKKMRD